MPINTFYMQILQMCYYVTSILVYIPQLITGMFPGSISKATIKMTKKVKADDKNTILFELEDKLSEREGMEVKCISIMCEELDDVIIHDITQFFQSLTEEQNTVYIIMHITTGGLSSECTIVSRIFRDYLSKNENNKIIIVVPELAISTGAQLALSGTNLIMGKLAHITPFDDQFREMGVKQLQRIIRNKKKYNLKGLTLKECDAIIQSRNMRKITKKEVKELLKYQKYDDDVINNVIKLFLNHKLYHTYPININMVRETGLKVEELKDKIIEDAFNELYEVCVK